MKKIYFCLTLLILFSTLTTVCASDNTILMSNATSDFVNSGGDVNSLDNNLSYTIQTKNLVKYYKNDSQFEFKIINSKNESVSGVNVLLKVDGKQYNKTTNSLGIGTLSINLSPGKYNITTIYGNSSVNNHINILSRFAAKNIDSTYGKSTNFSLKVVDKKGNPMNKQLITFKIGGKTYKTYTNSKGVTVLKLNLNAGDYVIKYYTDGISSKNTIKVRNYYKITIYKWKSGADVTRNKRIKSNIPDSGLVKKVVKSAKSGTPVIKFKGSKGKVVFITAGVHGNELSSQVAAMNLIKYLENHPIKGTLYIMPFMNPKATSKNIRNYGVNLNSKANVKGTISYKTVKLITKFKCSAYGDFHCTKPGGKPGKNVAMGSYMPTIKSAKLAKYISKKSKVSYLIYKKAAVEYPGALEDVVNLKHIPAVTCEVITPHGTIASGTVSKSLSMMKSFLKFNSLI